MSVIGKICSCIVARSFFVRSSRAFSKRLSPRELDAGEHCRADVTLWPAGDVGRASGSEFEFRHDDDDRAIAGVDEVGVNGIDLAAEGEGKVEDARLVWLGTVRERERENGLRHRRRRFGWASVPVVIAVFQK